MSRKKILIYAPSIEYGGGESYVFNLVNEWLNKFDCDISVLTPCVKLIDALSSTNAKTIYVNTSPTLSFRCFAGLLALNFHIRLIKPNVVFLNGLAECGALSRFIYKGGATFVSIGHSNEYWLKESFDKSIKVFIRRILSYNFFKYLDKVIVITEEALDSVKTQSLFDCKVAKIYNGIPAITLLPDLVNNKIAVFGRISRLCEGKGNELLIRAFSKFIKAGYIGELIVAGVGEQRYYLESLVEEHDLCSFVNFIGHVNPTDFYSQINCMISPSFMEGLPTVISEAFSCHIPVISTSVGGVPEMISHNYNGYLINPFSENEIFESLVRFTNERLLFMEFANNGYNSFLTKFSIEYSSKNTWSFIND